ncbi:MULTISPECIES: hypothetical protein [unclassified Streptomyces]|uniref:hypothetical protein n=1 Tax=unclassified Streptomyces TaxID=2593676 RepID=UPI0036E44483
MTSADGDTPYGELHAEFCRELALLRAFQRGARRAALEQAVRRLREGADFSEVFESLGVEVTASLSTSRHATPVGSPGAAPPPVGGPGAPVRGQYLCPAGACDRVEQRRAAEGPPECLLHERVLTFVPDA